MPDKKRGIQFKLKIVIGIVSAVYFISMVIFFINLMNSVQERLRESYQSLLNLYVSQLEMEFQEVDKFMNTLSADFDVNMLALQEPGTDEYELRLYQVCYHIFSYYFNYRILDGFYLYNSVNDQIAYIPDDKGHYAGFVREFVSEGNRENGWYPFRTDSGEKTVAARVHRINESQWLFAFINISNIAEEFGDVAADSGLLWDIEDKEGTVLYGDRAIRESLVRKDKYEVISGQLQYNSVALAFRLFVGKDIALEQNKVYIVSFMACLLIFSFVVIAATWFMRCRMVSPLHQLLDGMEQFAGGNDRVQLSPESGGEPEMRYALQSFNRMVDEIRENKFLIYESRLEKQKLLIQNMQSQINPHFFSNTTNLIYNLMKIGKTETAQECLMLLSSYYRYMTTIGQDLTTVKKEMEFVNSYLEIMKLRFPNKLTCETTCCGGLEGLRIPPLLIQPLAENCIKHGFTDRRKKFELTVRIYELEQAAVIDVIDNGKGFPEQYRGTFDHTVVMPEREGKEEDGENHVGMQNIYQRLMMQYGEDASLMIDWTGQSTLVRIRIADWIKYGENQIL